MTTQRLSLVVALVLASCTTKNQSSYIEILAVTGAVGTVPATVPPQCSPAAAETDVLLINPAQSSGKAYVNLQNFLTSNNNAALNRLNSNDFIAHEAKISYEVIGGGATIPSQTVPMSVLVPAGSAKKSALVFFPPGIGTPTQGGKTIRVTFHIEGHLVDGSSVRSNEYEYLFVTCSTDKCAGDCG